MGDVVVDGLADAVRALPDAEGDDARLARIRALEELRSAVAAVQAEQTAVYVASQRRAAMAEKRDRAEADRRIAAEVARARRVSPLRGQRDVGFAMILTGELPATFAALRAGRTSEWRAMLVARETAWLSREHRAEVDRELAPRLERFGDRRVDNEAKRLAYVLDPEGAVARTALAESERRVSLRPAPEAMARLGAVLPVAQGVAVWATLGRDADALIGTGQAGGRTRGQVMADLLVARVTGQQRAADVAVQVNLIMTDRALFAGGQEPAVLVGAGPIPAGHARRLVREPSAQVPRWIRRLYRAPRSGELLQMDARSRCFTPAQRHFIELRDEGLCATDWCDAPARHADHIRPATAGGRTHVHNGESLCANCNYTKGTRETRAMANDSAERSSEPNAPPESSAA